MESIVIQEICQLNYYKCQQDKENYLVYMIIEDNNTQLGILLAILCLLGSNSFGDKEYNQQDT